MPNNPESVEIIMRFFKVLETLKEHKIIRGTKTFTDKYGIDRRNMLAMRNAPHERDQMQMAWLSYLIVDWYVDAKWLMTGKGEMFTVSIEDLKKLTAA